MQHEKLEFHPSKMVNSPMPATPHALLILPDAIGDQVLRQPLFAAMHRAGWRVTILAKQPIFEVLRLVAPEATLVPLTLNPDARAESDASEEVDKIAAGLREEKPDLLICPLKNPTWIESRLFAALPEIRRIGVSARGPATSVRQSQLEARRMRLDAVCDLTIPSCVDDPEVQASADLAVALGLIRQASEYGRPEISRGLLPEATELLARLGLESNRYAFGSFAGVHNVSIKKIPQPLVDSLTEHLRTRHELPVLFTGSTTESTLVTAYAHAAGGMVWLGEAGSLPTCLALLAHARCYVGADTGMMHMAAALGIPVLALFGGGTWPRFLPLASRRAVITRQLPCFGCDWVCAFAQPHCLVDIKPAAVTHAIDWLLSAPETEGELLNRGDAHADNSPEMIRELLDNYNTAEIDRAARLECILRQQEELRDLRHQLAEATRERGQQNSPPPDPHAPPPGSDYTLIVTPTLNSEKHLRETLLSVASQVGDSVIHHHVQDGGSTDGTLKILESWAASLARGNPFGSARIRFTWSSEKDESMYESIGRGFDKLISGLPANRGSVLMTWINSDDLLAPASVQTATVAHHETGFDIITGLPTILAGKGCSGCIKTPRVLSRANIVRGLHDGRTLWFVTQEGTYWTLPLWEQSGGVDRTLRLAGDWDLWRKISEHGDWLELHTSLAYHRRHPGQLSHSLEKYWAEVDTVIAREGLTDATPVPDAIGYQCHLDAATGKLHITTLPVPMMNNDSPPEERRINFRTPTPPDFIAAMHGLSVVESWGRWSDARLGPCVVIQFKAHLPDRFHLRLRAFAFCGNAAFRRVDLIIGSDTHRLNITAAPAEYQLEIRLTEKTDTIRIIPYTNPDAPEPQPENGDPRRLGIALDFLAIRA